MNSGFIGLGICCLMGLVLPLTALIVWLTVIRQKPPRQLREDHDDRPRRDADD